jgi:hypothetical protein
MYGIGQAAFGEMFRDNGSNTSWSGNGFRYQEAIDFPNQCMAGGLWAVKNPDAYWPIFYVNYQYTGTGLPRWATKFQHSLSQVLASGTNDELYQQHIGNLIYLINHPNTATLSTQTITGFHDNGGGSYTISWVVPPGASSYRIKWGTKPIVDFIGWDAGTNLPIGDPVNTQNWFASSDAPTVPTPAMPGATQSLTIATGQNGLSAGNFMVKAYADGNAAPIVTVNSRPVPAAKTVWSGRIAK